MWTKHPSFAHFFASIGVTFTAVATDYNWVALWAVPVSILLGFRAAKALGRHIERIRLAEAGRWDNLVWSLVIRAEKLDGRYTCHYCNAEWMPGEGRDSAPHKNSCLGEAYWNLHDKHHGENRLFIEEGRE